MDRGTSLLLSEMREMGALANIALSHGPDCDCSTVCRRLKEHYPAYILPEIIRILVERKD